MISFGILFVFHSWITGFSKGRSNPQKHSAKTKCMEKSGVGGGNEARGPGQGTSWRLHLDSKGTVGGSRLGEDIITY